MLSTRAAIVRPCLRLTVRGLSHSQSVLAQAKGMLQQKSAVLKAIKHNPSLYSAISPVFNASIGQHMRHSLDHFQKLLSVSLEYSGDADVNPEIVDYDTRVRGTAEESDPAAAERMIHYLLELIGKAEDRLSAPILVRFLASGDGEHYVVKSTVARELSFAAHHAIHHMAFIKHIANELHVKLPDDVGMAPSTIAHMKHINK